MKKLILIVAVLTIVASACKSKPHEKTPVEEKVEAIVKSESEKMDSVKRYYEEKARKSADKVPDMPTK
jgi:mRNA-degrading endonuclease HigB of HigAB toxin-antitoxin module